MQSHPLDFNPGSDDDSPWLSRVSTHDGRSHDGRGETRGRTYTVVIKEVIMSAGCGREVGPGIKCSHYTEDVSSVGQHREADVDRACRSIPFKTDRTWNHCGVADWLWNGALAGKVTR